MVEALNMTQEDKQLLLIDLCARLPYKIIVNWRMAKNPAYIKNVGVEKITLYREYPSSIGAFVWTCYVDEIKPYLRPMSSMTEEETDTYDRLVMCNASWVVDEWLNTHHFDYRGLIEKGLALEAPEEMYKEK